MSGEQQYITPQEAAVILNRTPRQVLNFVRAGVLKDVRELKTGTDGRTYRLLGKDEVTALATLISDTKHAPDLLPSQEERPLPPTPERLQEQSSQPSGFDLAQVIRATVEAATRPLRETIESLRADLTSLVKEFGEVKQKLGRAEKEAEEASEYKAILEKRFQQSLDQKITLKGILEKETLETSRNITVLVPKPPEEKDEEHPSPPEPPPSES